MTLDEIKIYAAIGASVLSVAVAVTSLLKARKDGAAAAVKIAVQEELQKKKIDDLETSISTLRAELNGVKSGFEAGIVKVQDSLHSVVEMLTKLQITVAVLVDRDGREQHRPEILLSAPPADTAPRRRRTKGVEL